MKKFLIILSFAISAASLSAQNVPNRKIQFLAPPVIDSVVCELFYYFDSIGIADNFIVKWTIGPFPDRVWKYTIYEIPNRSEYDSNGWVSNAELWLKNRTERELQLTCGLRIPLINDYDVWASLKGDKEPTANLQGLGSDWTLYIQEYNTSKGQIVKRRWRFTRDDDGNKVLISLWEDEDVKIK